MFFVPVYRMESRFLTVLALKSGKNMVRVSHVHPSVVLSIRSLTKALHEASIIWNEESVQVHVHVGWGRREKLTTFPKCKLNVSPASRANQLGVLTKLENWLEANARVKLILQLKKSLERNRERRRIWNMTFIKIVGESRLFSKGKCWVDGAARVKVTPGRWGA